MARQKLAESEAKYYKFVEEINNIIIGFDHNGRISFFNHFSEKLFGYTREEVTGKPFVGTIIPCVDSRGQDNSKICKEIFLDPMKFYANESEGVCKDGRRIIFTWSAKAVRDKSGTITEILIDGNDITELIIANQKIQENSEQLKNEHDFVNTVIQTSGALIIVIDLDGKITRFNKAGEELTGYTENEVIGQSVFDLFIPEEEREEVVAVAARLFAGERWVDFENHWITKTGEKRFIHWRNSNLLNDKGVPISVVATGIDITDRKKAEDALRSRTEELIAANQDLKSFSYSVSHDIRTPLTAIKGFSEILRNDYGTSFDQRGKSILDHIIIGSDKIQSIINDLLSLARISQVPLNCQMIDLSQIAGSVINELRQAEPLRNIIISIASSMPAWADPGFMNITLTNLVENAWKYTSKTNEARIDIGSMALENEHVFFIRDNGIGFDMKLTDRLFEPFQRLHSDDEFKGTGIGLAIVQRIIQRHGGKIWAESEPGKGTVFYFTLQSCVQ